MEIITICVYVLDARSRRLKNTKKKKRKMVLQSICGGFDNFGWDPVQAMRRDRRMFVYALFVIRTMRLNTLLFYNRLLH